MKFQLLWELVHNQQLAKDFGAQILELWNGFWCGICFDRILLPRTVPLQLVGSWLSTTMSVLISLIFCYPPHSLFCQSFTQPLEVISFFSSVLLDFSTSSECQILQTPFLIMCPRKCNGFFLIRTIGVISVSIFLNDDHILLNSSFYLKGPGQETNR